MIPVIAPVPLILPDIDTFWLHSEFLSIEQSEVTFTLNEKSARSVLGLAGKGKVPKSKTREPFGPSEGSK